MTSPPRHVRLEIDGAAIGAGLDLACMVVTKQRAAAIAALPPTAVQLTKRAAYRSFGADQATALELAATYQGIAQNLPDHLEALGR